MLGENREMPTLFAEAEALLRRGDAEGAIRLVSDLCGRNSSPATSESRATLDRLRLRLHGALKHRLVEAPGLSNQTRDEIRVALAVGALFGIGVSHLAARVWPALSQEQYSFPLLDRFAQRLAGADAGALDPWLRRIAAGLSGREPEAMRAELLMHHAYFSVLHSAELAEMERQLLARPAQLSGVRVQALRRSGCPVCVWPDVLHTAENLAELPALPAHPGCRCIYRSVPLPS
ncbi:MAG TPA: hypothetical protein VFE37_20960 [Chloroflexota bacterium]|nr:hypothetical protein [Chloroflexota bacterium]